MGKDPERGKYASPEGSRTWEYLSSIFCAVSTFCIGNVVGWNSPSLNELRAPDSRIKITTEETSSLAATLSIGHLIAFPLSIYLVDHFGRRNSILMSAVPMMISWLMILLAEHVTTLFLARIAAGLSMGLIISTCPIYMAEILSPNIRGSLGSISGITVYCGVFFMFVAAPYLGIRWTAGFCMGFTVLLLISFWFIPESPYFLVKVGRIEAAENSLEKLRGKTDVSEEIEMIKATFLVTGKLKTNQSDKEEDVKSKSSFKQLFTIRGNLKAFMIGLLLTTLQHFCGFQPILYYCHDIFEDMGSAFDPYMASMIFSILQIISAAATIFVLDKFGRKPLLLFSGMISAFFLSVIAAYFYLLEHTEIMHVKEYSMIPSYSVFALVIALNFGVISVPGIVQAEIFSPDVKMLANCIVMICGSFMTIFITKSYFLMAESWGLGHSVPFAGFAVITFVSTTLITLFIPETKGKTLFEIQKDLNA